ncbi:MAG TPA: Gfo/Idh/MocA family oxidoreductase [Bryobacteraceae bacterium]|nr:Gfo/Idh/MocA family oxidoreductase [Bryobacteraceae bacterium]
MDRRMFLGGAAGLLAARSHARAQGANERLRIGVIGCGGMATGHMRTLVRNKEAQNIEIVAVCDVYDKRLQKAVEITGGKPYKDYRSLLAVKDIDYVLIASPEHWHFQMALDAIDAGKHVYVEKPMTHTSEESKKLIAKLKGTKLKLQVGVQGTSDDSYITARDYVKKGVLGDVVIAQIDYSRNYKDDFWLYPVDADARPGENLDWKAWLGSAPKRAWDPERYFRWRRYWDYSGGIATDLFVHRVTRIIKALDLGFPERAVGSGGKFHFKQSIAEIPDTFNIMLEYPGGPNVLLVSSMANDTPVDHVLRGHKATLKFTRTGFTITPQQEYAKDMQEITFQKKGREDVGLHHANLQSAIRRNEPLNCDAELGYRAVVACEMGVASFRRRKYASWDKAKEKIVLS